MMILLISILNEKKIMVKSIDRYIHSSNSNNILIFKDKTNSKETISRYHRKYSFNIFKESFRIDWQRDLCFLFYSKFRPNVNL